MAVEPMATSAGKPAEEQVVESPGSLLDKIIIEGRLAQSDDEKTRAKDWLIGLVDQVLDKQMLVSKDTEQMLTSRIAAIDEAISNQLNEVMHAQELQKLEASWRGLHYLVFQTETSPMLKINVLNVSKKELLKDLKKASEFDQSETFKKIHDPGFGTLGGEPYAALIGDYEFERHPGDIDVLEKMSNVAAAAHAPFIAAASPELFNWQSFTELAGPRDLAKIFDNDAYIRWKSFRESEDSRYVALTLPHILLRLPYGKKTAPVEGFDYEEKVTGADHSKYLWGNAAYAFGARLTDAFSRYRMVRSHSGG